ncbi:response regulator [Georgenia sp. Z1491]|uniref:response regulator n=1 Tax=Georgenia sp. Z1491 TaxID=3416707 RepID=UPI003CFAE3C0
MSEQGTPPAGAPVKVILIDDDPLVRAGLRMLLHGGEIEIVAEGDDGRVAQRLVEEHRPDVVLMDVRMPVMDGVTATQRLTDAGAPTRVIVLTTFDSDDMVISALRAGAQGFLLKDTPPADLVAAVRRAARGEPALSPSVAAQLMARVAAPEEVDDGESAAEEARAAFAELTEREQDVARAVARGLSNAEIASELFLGVATVKTHVGRVFNKLGVANRVHVARMVQDAGEAH